MCFRMLSYFYVRSWQCDTCVINFQKLMIVLLQLPRFDWYETIPLELQLERLVHLKVTVVPLGQIASCHLN